MKKKNLLTALVCLVLAACLLAGCTKPADSESPASEPEQTEQPEGEGDAQTDEEPVSIDPNDLYWAFLNGEAAAKSRDGIPALTAGSSYDYTQLKEAAAQARHEDGIAEYLSSVSYALIDCGADGEPELLLDLGFSLDPEEGYVAYEDYYVLKAFPEGLEIVANEYSFYRTEAIINAYGGVHVGGSSSAYSMYYSNYILDADGERTFLYSEEYLYSMPEVFLPSEYLREDVLPEDYPGYTFAEWPDGYELAVYNFEEPAREMVPDWEAYKDGYFFTAWDAEGNPAEPTQEWAARNEELGIHYVSESESVAMIDEHVRALGVAPYLMDKTPAELTVWETLVQTSGASSGYGDLDAGAAAQLHVIADCLDVWYHPGPERENAYVYYTVSDLNQNGRLEVVRTDYCWGDETSLNNFYEVTEDGLSMAEMTCDAPGWGSGTPEIATCTLLNAETPVRCLWHLSEDGFSSVYDYVLETTRRDPQNEGGEETDLMILEFGTDGTIKTRVLGSYHKTAEGTEFWRDAGGQYCGQDVYDGAIDAAFPKDEGWHEAAMSWDWFLLESDAMIDNRLEDIEYAWGEFYLLPVE